MLNAQALAQAMMNVTLTPAIGKDWSTPRGAGKPWIQDTFEIERPERKEDKMFQSLYHMRPTNRFGRPIKKAKRQGLKPGKDYPSNKRGHNKNPHKKR